MKDEIVLFGTFRVTTQHIFVCGDMYLVNFKKYTPTTLDDYKQQTKIYATYPDSVALSNYTGTLYFLDSNQYIQFDMFTASHGLEKKFKMVSL